MRAIDILKLALRNVIDSRLKGFLSIISVCIAIASISLISGIGWGVADEINDELSIINNQTAMLQPKSGKVREDDIEIIRNTEGVTGAMPYIFEMGAIYAKTLRNEAVIVGVDKDFNKIFDIKTLHGADLSEEISFEGKSVIVDETFAQSLYYRTNIVGKKLQISYGQSVEEYKVVSVIESPKAGIETIMGTNLPAVVYVPYQTINEEYGENRIAGVAISCDEMEDEGKDLIIRRLSFNNPTQKYNFENISSYKDMAVRITDILALMISAIAGISVIVGGIGMMSSMISGVENRKTEIGIYMALGMREKDILRMHLAESVLITTTGGLLGIVLSIAVIQFIKMQGILGVDVNISAMLICFTSAVLSGCIFGYIPAKRAAKMDPISAIRWE